MSHLPLDGHHSHGGSFLGTLLGIQGSYSGGVALPQGGGAGDRSWAGDHAAELTSPHPLGAQSST